jgi:uncharacterized membrane protein YozB (DUF420 family)
MIEVRDLPTLNAALNATSAVLVLAGYLCIRAGKRLAHLGCMLAAVTVSALFLCSYLFHKYHAGHTVFTGQGWIRPVYFTLLLTHTVLAAAVALWLVPVTVWRAARQRLDAHKGIARWTLPVWLYVSVTGVIIYFMLYHWYAPA